MLLKDRPFRNSLENAKWLTAKGVWNIGHLNLHSPMHFSKIFWETKAPLLPSSGGLRVNSVFQKILSIPYYNCKV